MDSGSFTSSILALIVMVGALAALPWLLKRWQQRQQSLRNTVGISTQVLSAVVVGPNQRVVTVEVGQGEQKTCLVLGVSPQSIHCLHVLGQPPAAPPAAGSFAGAMAQLQTATPAPAIHPASPDL